MLACSIEIATPVQRGQTTAASERREVEFISNLYEEDGAGVIQCNVRDITERKRAEAALASSERELRLLAETMPQIVWISRADGADTYFNQQWVDYTGLTLEEIWGWLEQTFPRRRPAAGLGCLAACGQEWGHLLARMPAAPGGRGVSLVVDSGRAGAPRAGGDNQMVRHLHRYS